MLNWFCATSFTLQNYIRMFSPKIMHSIIHVVTADKSSTQDWITDFLPILSARMCCRLDLYKHGLLAEVKGPEFILEQLYPESTSTLGK